MDELTFWNMKNSPGGGEAGGILPGFARGSKSPLVSGGCAMLGEAEVSRRLWSVDGLEEKQAFEDRRCEQQRQRGPWLEEGCGEGQ